MKATAGSSESAVRFPKSRAWWAVFIPAVLLLVACNEKPVCGPNPVLPSQIIESLTVNVKVCG